MRHSSHYVTFFLSALLYSTSGYASPQSSNSAETTCEIDRAAIDLAARSMIARDGPGASVEVSQNGRKIFVGSYGLANLEDNVPVTPQTVFKLASITKQFTAAAVLLLAEDGKLRLDDRLDRYVPELPQAPEVTLYQLLVQTSGLPDYANDQNLLSTKSVQRSSSAMIELIAALKPPLLFQPGTQWSYSNSNYVLLGRVVEKVSGQSLETFFRDRLFRPAGLSHAAFDDPAQIVAHRAQGYRRAKAAEAGYVHSDWLSPSVPRAAGALQATADDLIRWSDALFSGRIIAPSSIERMTAPGLLTDGRTTGFGMPRSTQTKLGMNYAMGVYVSPSQLGKRIWHDGSFDGFRTRLTTYPDRKMTIVILQNGEADNSNVDAVENAVVSGTKCSH